MKNPLSLAFGMAALTVTIVIFTPPAFAQSQDAEFKEIKDMMQEMAKTRNR
jgi:ABC-type molybdate transport system permease subunit